MRRFVSRAGEKLDHALNAFALDVRNFTCADFGANTGGFTDCLLKRGASRVYAIDTGYGALDWNLRKDDRVIVMERTNAMHVTLPEPMDLVVIDVAWTRQKNILPSARKAIKPDGSILTLIKPHYEADAKLLVKGVLSPEKVEDVVSQTLGMIAQMGLQVIATIKSPIAGAGGNIEVLAHLRV